MACRDGRNGELGAAAGVQRELSPAAVAVTG